MISIEEALDIVSRRAEGVVSPDWMPAERVELARSFGRVLRETVAADMDSPPFARSIRDGFAVRAADTEPEKPAVTKGRIKQSIVHWCFQDHWSVEQTCRVAKQLGCVSVELVDPMHWPLLNEHGLTCAIAGSTGRSAG